MDTSSFLTGFIILFAVYLLASTAGFVSEKSGITNIAINGTMVIGALAYIAFANWDAYCNWFGVFAPFVTLFFAVLAGIIYAQILSFATVNLMADQIITGTALNLFAPLLSGSIIYLNYFQGGQSSIPVTEITWYFIPIVFLIITLLIVFVIMLVLNKSAFGLRLKSAGENPFALENIGYSTNKVRWEALTIAGALAGLAGGMFMFYNSNPFSGTVNGAGYVAIAIVVIGQYKMKGIIATSFVLSLILAFTIPLIGLIDKIPYELMNIIPFIIPLIALCIFKTKKNPRGSGVPYKKNIQE